MKNGTPDHPRGQDVSDEAALAVINRALHEWDFGVEPCDAETTGAIECQPSVRIARAAVVVDELRAAGFLIVHHTKET